MTFSTLALSLLLLVGLNACSNKQVYDGLQKRNESRCNELPLTQQQQCIDEMHGPDYEAYRRELKKP